MGDVGVDAPGADDSWFVSVAVPTRNRAAMLHGCLEHLVRQDYPTDRYEVVVVDDGSTDDTAAVVERFTGEAPVVRYVHQPRAGLNAARNTALRVCVGDPVCFVDDDEQAPAVWLRSIVRAAAGQPDAGCLGGPIRMQFEAEPPRSCGREPLDDGELDLGAETKAVTHVWGGNMALRRAAVALVGEFREDLRMGGEETEWQDRLRAAGGCVVYTPDAGLQHRRTREHLAVRRLAMKRFRRGRNHALNAGHLGQPLVARRSLRPLRNALVHAVRQRCAAGLLQGAQHAGRLLGTVEARVRAR